MAEILTFSSTPLPLLSQICFQASSQRHASVVSSRASQFRTTPDTYFLRTRPVYSPPSFSLQRKFSSWGITAGFTSDTRAPTTFMVNSTEERNSALPDSGGAGGNFGDAGGNGGGGDSGGNGNNDESGGRSDGSEDHKKNRAILMSQKFTLGYALLVGVGGVAGYLKSGSRKSLVAGGLSASVLGFVYTQLPGNPVLASSIGLGCSAALLGLMGSRFKKSGKVFPAGVVSIASLVMTAGYLHGIMRGMH